MTTIVVDREAGYIAADRMAVANDGEIAIPCPKIRRVHFDGVCDLIACAGNEGPATIFEEWYAWDNWDEPLDPLGADDGDDFTAIILTHERKIYAADKWMRPYPIHSPRYAAGSGGALAWAVLEAGCTLDKAMEVALRMDPNSGMGFDVEYL